MRDDVVELARDARPFLRHGEPGAFLPFVLELRRERLELAVRTRAVRSARPREPRAGDEERVEGGVRSALADHRAAGDGGDQPRDGPRQAGVDGDGVDGDEERHDRGEALEEHREQGLGAQCGDDDAEHRERERRRSASGTSPRASS